MQLTLTKYDPCWVQITPAIPKFITAMKASVKKANYRKWDSNQDAWMFHWKYIGTILPLAKRYYSYVDYSALPTDWQMLAAGARATDVVFDVQQKPSPFATLYVTEDAPLEVVRAAYKALAAKHHPDAGGTEAEFTRIDLAYREILEARCV